MSFIYSLLVINYTSKHVMKLIYYDIKLYHMHPEDFLSLDEWHRLLAAAPSLREAALLWLMTGCGLRVSEAAALKVEHLDGVEDTLLVINGKGGKRRISIPPSLSWMPIFRAKIADISSRAEIGIISLPGRSRGCWTKLLRRQGSRR